MSPTGGKRLVVLFCIYKSHNGCIPLRSHTCPTIPRSLDPWNEACSHIRLPPSAEYLPRCSLCRLAFLGISFAPGAYWHSLALRFPYQSLFTSCCTLVALFLFHIFALFCSRTVLWQHHSSTSFGLHHALIHSISKPYWPCLDEGSFIIPAGLGHYYTCCCCWRSAFSGCKSATSCCRTTSCSMILLFDDERTDFFGEKKTPNKRRRFP